MESTVGGPQQPGAQRFFSPEEKKGHWKGREIVVLIAGSGAMGAVTGFLIAGPLGAIVGAVMGVAIGMLFYAGYVLYPANKELVEEIPLLDPSGGCLEPSFSDRPPQQEGSSVNRNQSSEWVSKVRSFGNSGAFEDGVINLFSNFLSAEMGRSVECESCNGWADLSTIENDMNAKTTTLTSCIGLKNRKKPGMVSEGFKVTAVLDWETGGVSITKCITEKRKFNSPLPTKVDFIEKIDNHSAMNEGELSPQDVSDAGMPPLGVSHGGLPENQNSAEISLFTESLESPVPVDFSQKSKKYVNEIMLGFKPVGKIGIGPLLSRIKKDTTDGWVHCEQSFAEVRGIIEAEQVLNARQNIAFANGRCFRIAVQEQFYQRLRKGEGDSLRIVGDCEKGVVTTQNDSQNRTTTFRTVLKVLKRRSENPPMFEEVEKFEAIAVLNWDTGIAMITKRVLEE